VGIDADEFWAAQGGGEQGTIDEPIPLAECTTDNEWVSIRAQVVGVGDALAELGDGDVDRVLCGGDVLDDS
jgi:hypothetical protein